MAVTGEMQLLCLHVESMVNYGQQVNAVLMGEVYLCNPVPRNHLGDTFRVIGGLLNNYGKYGWNVKHEPCMWNLWWIRDNMLNAVLTW